MLPPVSSVSFGALSAGSLDEPPYRYGIIKQNVSPMPLLHLKAYSLSSPPFSFLSCPDNSLAPPRMVAFEYSFMVTSEVSEGPTPNPTVAIITNAEIANSFNLPCLIAWYSIPIPKQPNIINE